MKPAPSPASRRPPQPPPRRLPQASPLWVVVCLADRSPLARPITLRGLEVPPRGWSVSLHSGDSWQDLAGCDFVLDLIGQTEDLGDLVGPHSYPIAPHGL